MVGDVLVVLVPDAVVLATVAVCLTRGLHLRQRTATDFDGLRALGQQGEGESDDREGGEGTHGTGHPRRIRCGSAREGNHG